MLWTCSCSQVQALGSRLYARQLAHSDLLFNCCRTAEIFLFLLLTMVYHGSSFFSSLPSLRESFSIENSLSRITSLGGEDSLQSPISLEKASLEKNREEAKKVKEEN